MRPLCPRCIAGADGLCDPGLGPGIATLADRPGAGRGGAPLARSLAWALRLDPGEIALPTSLPALRKPSWLELFKYPRSIAAACRTGLSQTGGVGLALWQVTLFVLVFKVTPPEASFLAA